MISGRERELAQLEAVVTAVRNGQTEVLVIAGEAGIGKTALLDMAVRSAAGMRLLRTTGLPAEAQIGFVGLVDLLTPLLKHRSRLPPTQCRVVERALAVDSVPAQSEGDNPLALRAATLALLAAAAEEKPTLVVVDDAQWVDQESLDTLLFAARRLSADRIGFLFGVRIPAGAPPGAAPPVPALAGFPLLHLTGLNQENSSALLAAAAPHLADPLVRDAVLATAAGNPLALQEIPRLLDTDPLTSAALARPLPVGHTIRQSVGKTLAQLNDDTRTALLVAAATQDPSWADVPVALAGFGLTLTDLEPADEAGLIHLGAGRGFRHPLIQAAVYHEAPSTLRRAAHRALAAAAHGHQSAEVRAGHLAAAATGPDPTVAAALVEAGRAANARGAWRSAMISFRRAAQFTIDPDLRTLHLLSAAQAALLAGLPTAAEIAEEVLSMAPDPLTRARAHRIRATLWNVHGDARRAALLLLAEADRIDHVNQELAVQMRLDATVSALHCGDLALADTAARAVVERSTAADDELLAARVVRGWVRFCRAEADPEAPFEVPLAEVLARIPDGPGALPFTMLALPWMEYYDEARQVLDRIRHDDSMSPDLLSFSQIIDADLAFRTGQWATGIATATEGARLAGHLGFHNTQARALTLVAQFEAAMGRSDHCEQQVTKAVELAQSSGLIPVEVFGAAALGLLAIGLRDYEMAVAQLDLVRSSLESADVRHPGILPWAADLIEAFHRIGDTESAERLLADHERRVAHTRYRTGEIGALRCRILLGHTDEALEPAIEKLAYDSSVPAPFEQARLLLAYGEHLRMRGRRVAARRPLRDAGRLFTRLGATPWAERAAAELRAAGGRGARAVGSPVDQLSPQEWQVVRQVARGARNREIATVLFLSPKTVEGHLSSVYRKLGIRSRAELVARMAEAGSG